MAQFLIGFIIYLGHDSKFNEWHSLGNDTNVTAERKFWLAKNYLTLYQGCAQGGCSGSCGSFLFLVNGFSKDNWHHAKDVIRHICSSLHTTDCRMYQDIY